MKTNHKPAFGFTLLELLITLALAAIVLTTGIPSLLDTMTENRVKTVMMDLNQDIIAARSFAISYETNVTLCPLSDKNECTDNWKNGYTLFTDHNQNAKFDSTDEKKLVVRNKIDNADTFIFSDGKFIQYRFDGTTINSFANNDEAIFSYCPEVDEPQRYSKALLISISGRPRMSQDLDNDGRDEIYSANEHITCGNN
ncbi:GspH/FimT family protein [Gayadomonas joobiniege]|uniref:GspH/FimT family protein n=1 Tax=Gayadomonas joobiniege TaxID=1234606 RepID=UPI0003660AED|nr:GspH/FimT family protein [Gayadomonas joobiniege]